MVRGQRRKFGQDTGVTEEKCHGIFNDHSESGPRFNVSSPLLLNAEGASTRETDLFPMHARWCPRGSRKGA